MKFSAKKLKKSNSGQAVSPQDAEQDNEEGNDNEEDNQNKDGKNKQTNNSQDNEDKDEPDQPIQVSDVFLNMKLDGQHGKPSRNEQKKTA